MEQKIIFSARLARRLIKGGFRVVDIRPNKINSDRSVFIFDNTPELNDLIDKRNEALLIKDNSLLT